MLPITQPGDGEAAPPGDSSLAEGHPLLPRQTLTRRAVLARKPVGMNDADAEYWKGLSSTPLPLWDDEEFIFWSGGVSEIARLNLKDALRKSQPNTEFSDSGDTFAWVNPLKIYGATKPYTWQVATISSIKFAEVIANRPKPVHILYESSQIDNLPPDSLMTLAEIGLITSRSFKVPRIYRWDVDTFDQRINGGSSPVDNVIWKAGDAQMYKELTDIRVSPRPRDEEAIYSSIDETLGNRGVAGKPAVPLSDNQS